MDTGFFKWVWRFNALVIAAAVTLLLLVILWESTSSLRRDLFNQRTTDTLTAPTVQEGEPQQTTAVEGRRYFGPPVGSDKTAPYALPLRITQDIENAPYVSKSSVGNTINYKIVDTQTQTSRWLFSPANRLILDPEQIIWRKGNQPPLTLGTLLKVVDADTNADARLSTRDARTLYLVDPEWSAPTVIAQGVNSVLHTRAVSPSAFEVIYRKGAATHITRVNAATGETLAEQIISTQD